VEFADVLVICPELGILEREITCVTREHAVIIIPAGNETYGHGTHTRAGVPPSAFRPFGKTAINQGAICHSVGTVPSSTQPVTLVPAIM
jgi:hypothetical protein